MKTLVPFILVIILQLTIASCKNPVNKALTDCEKGTQKAEQDAQNDKYEIQSYGLPWYEDYEFQTFYEKYVLDKYGIKLGNGGCEVYEEKECYATKMRDIVLNTFGNDIFEKANRNARVQYDILVQSQIENNHIFTTVDAKPKFILKNETLGSYLDKKLSNKEINRKIRASFIVEKDGDLSDITIDYSNDQKYNEALIKILSDMPKWQPGVLNEQIVRTKVGLPITIKNK